MESSEIGKKFIAIGYMAGILISLVGLLASAGYLFFFMRLSPDPVSISDTMKLLSVTAERRMLLLSTAIFVGMCFGFLGFALFLIQAEGDVNGEVSAGEYKLKLARLSPGLFVILCATVMIIVASTFRIQYSRTDIAGSVGAGGAASSSEQEEPSPSRCKALGTC